MIATAHQTAHWGEHGRWFWKGWSCHWRVSGPEQGPAILLLHGFERQRPLAPNGTTLGKGRGYQVFALDPMGFGASDQPTIPLDNRVWGRQVNAFVEQVVQRPAVLMGNSLGALTALTAACCSLNW